MNDSRTISLTTFGQTLTGIDDVKQCVVLLVTTPKGSDPLRPNFGLDIFSFLDKPSNQLAGIKKDILQQIANYEPRITKVDNITVANDVLGKVNISIKFTSVYGSATITA
jgi:phage baseplate assembly protein W